MSFGKDSRSTKLSAWNLPMPEVPPTTNARVGPGKREVMDMACEL